MILMIRFSKLIHSWFKRYFSGENPYHFNERKLMETNVGAVLSVDFQFRFESFFLMNN